MPSNHNLLSYHIKLGSCSLMSCFLLHKYPSYNATFVPRLLDGLHPFVALTLLLRPQFQRLLSIMTKHDEEVVLRRDKHRKNSSYLWPWDQTCVQHRSSVAPTLALQKLLHCDWEPQPIRHMAPTYGNIAFNCICWSRSSLSQIHPISCFTRLPCTQTGRVRQDGGRAGASTQTTSLYAHWIKTSSLVYASPLHQPLIITIN